MALLESLVGVWHFHHLEDSCSLVYTTHTALYTTLSYIPYCIACVDPYRSGYIAPGNDITLPAACSVHQSQGIYTFVVFIVFIMKLRPGLLK